MFNFYLCVSTVIAPTGVKHFGIAGTGQYFSLQCHLSSQAHCCSCCFLGPADKLWAQQKPCSDHMCISPGYPITHVVVGFWKNTGSQVHPMIWGFPVRAFSSTGLESSMYPGLCQDPRHVWDAVLQVLCLHIPAGNFSSPHHPFHMHIAGPAVWGCPEAALDGAVSSWRGRERMGLVFVY